MEMEEREEEEKAELSSAVKSAKRFPIDLSLSTTTTETYENHSQPHSLPLLPTYSPLEPSGIGFD